jgi:RHS repeat-associated protein
MDLNADGCTDLVYLHYTGRWRARYSGCGSPYWAAPEVVGPAWSGSPLGQVLDWNGDGQDDLLLRGSGSWQVMTSAGDRLLPPANTGVPLGFPGGTVRADLNGDGLDDLLTLGTGELRFRLHAGSRPDLLLAVSDGFGVSASFSYAPLTQPEAYTRRTGATWPQRDVQDTRPVVVELALGDGSGSTRSTRYAYEGLRLDLQGRGSLGFARRIATETRAGATLRVEESWRQDFPFTGLPQARVLRQASGRAVVETSWQYAQLTLGSGAAQRRRPYLSESSERVYEAGGAYDGLHHTTRAYSTAHVDATSGLVLDASWTTTEHGTGLNAGASRTQRLWLTGVLNDTANWCLGRPLGAQLTESHTLAGGSPLTRNVALSWDGLRCRPTQQQVEPGSSQWQVTTALGYDAFGNVSSVAVTGAGMATRTTRVAWGSRGQAPVSVTDPLSQMRTITWDAARGLPLSVTDENGLVTRWTYDALGRLDSELRPDGTRRVVARSACSAATDCGDPAARYRVRSSEQSPWAVTHWYEEWSFDSLDRWVVHREQQANGALSVRSRRFDGLGRLSRENLPHWPGAAAGHLQYAYDLLDRPTGAGLHAASGALVRSAGVEYRGLALTERDALGRTSTRTATAWGDLVSVTDAAGGTSGYRYDAAGRLLQAVDAYGSVVTSLAWNPRGMKVAQTDMDLGQWTFTPNALGELVALRDAKGQQVTFAYDALSRLVSRTEPEGTTAWTWGRPADNTAGGKVAGRVTQVAGPGYAEQYVYDGLSRPVRRAIIADGTYEYAYGYNTLGQLDSLTYPASTSGYRLKLGYDYAYGRLARIRDFNAPATMFWQLEAVDAAGRVLDETRGAGLRIITGRDPLTGQIDYRQSGIGGGAAVQNLAWRWDGNGNMVERSDLNRGVTERFNYDALDRLDDVRRNGALTLDLAYDLAGNITSRSDVGSYAYHPTRRHAVVTAGGRSYVYDANGNMTSRGGAAIAWTSFNQPSSIGGAGGASSAFWYGPDRQPWKQVATSGGVSETTVYAGGLFERVSSGSVTTWKHYVATPGGVAAIHIRSSDGAAPRTWLATQDALGSTDRVVAASGATELATSFEPFGARRGASWSGAPTAAELAAAARTTRDGFTGHVQLDHLGLVHMGGRVYDPLIGRFLSPDPIVQAPFWSQDLNRYAYAWNNPLSIVDPTGYTEEVPCRSFDDVCAQIVVIGKREFPNSFDGLSSLQLSWLRAGYNGQAASAWERDPCGQDGSAGACRLSGRDAGPPAPVSPVANVAVSPPVGLPERGSTYYFGKAVEWIGYTLIAFDLANTATGILAGPDTGLLGAPLVAVAVNLRQSTGSAGKALQTYWPPNRGFMGSPTRGVLKPGTRIDRYGSELGTFASPAGTPFGARALPPHAASAPLRQYEVLQPLPTRSGTAAPWFGQPGGGMQYEFAQPIETLIEQGFLRRIP